MEGGVRRSAPERSTPRWISGQRRQGGREGRKVEGRAICGDG